MRRKKTFVLLELIIAFALVSCVVLPFLPFPYRNMQKEIDLLYEMELERIAGNRLVEIQIRMYTDPSLAKRIFEENPNKRKSWEKNLSFSVSLPSGIQRTFTEKVYFHCDQLKKGEGNKKWALATIRIVYLNPKDKRKHVLSERAEIILERTI